MLKLVVTVVAQVLLTFQVLSSWIVAFSSLNENPLLWMKTVAATSVRITPDTQLYVWWWKLCLKYAAKLFSRQKGCGFLLNGETSNLKSEWKLRAQSHRADPQGPVCLNKPLPHRDPESRNKAASVFTFTWHTEQVEPAYCCACVWLLTASQHSGFRSSDAWQRRHRRLRNINFSSSRSPFLKSTGWLCPQQFAMISL